jgi:prolyl-tRNA synthetase
MRYKDYFIPTQREIPADVEIISHNLMLRAGLIMQVASGIYNYLPAGLRVIKSIENIVRHCMDEAGAIEILMPAIIPSELWKESGRWQKYGKELLRLKDRHDREFCFGPTHEEVVTDIIRKHIKSYKQLPINLYQIQTKFRDEIRPRFGLMRCREFIMKDAYSFDIDEKHCKESYDKMYNAYCKIFDKMGLMYKVVEADTGAIGGNVSHEFMVIADTGEDTIIYCDNCGYAANLEKAAVGMNSNESVEEKEEALTKVFTPNMRTVEEVANFLGVDISKIVKTLILKCGENFSAFLIRGDYELNLVKVKNSLTGELPEFATAEEIKIITNGPLGFSGPIGLKIPIYADYSVKNLKNFVTGANEKDVHYKNVNVGRDFHVEGFYDLRNAKEGDSCCRCASNYKSAKGIEVGHIFMLGTKYSEAMGAYYRDDKGMLKPIIMGCYGIGIGRIAAASIEQNHDDKGIIWPIQIAPFEVIIIPINTNDEGVIKYSNKLYEDLVNLGIKVLIDDREERVGVKFNDAELIGFPLRINIGRKSLEKGEIELNVRKSNKTINIKVDEAKDHIKRVIEELKK